MEVTLLHLQNKETYSRLSKKDAYYQPLHNVREKLNSWLSWYHQIIGKKATQLIRLHMAQTSKTPFGQFYIMYEIHKG
jgi:hypothetical protein